jgi:uncharacterized membrane protein
MSGEKKHKKSLILIFAIMLTLSSFAWGAAENNHYIVSGSQESSGNISEGDTFIYNLRIENKSGGDLTGIKVYVSGDFSLATGSVFDFGELSINGDETMSLPIRYNGSGNKMNLLIDDGSGHSIVDNVTILNVVETSTATPGIVDKDRFYPEYSVLLDQSVPVFYAGQTSEMSIKLENTTTYYGKDVQLQLLNNSENLPFDLTSNSITSDKQVVNSKESKSFKMKMKPLANAQSGFYTLPLEITYKNVYGLEKKVSKNIQVEIVNNKMTPTLVIDQIKIENDVLIPGASQQILIGFKNLGDLEAKNIQVTLEGFNIDGLMLDKDTKVKTISSIMSNKSNFVIYDVITNEKITEERVLLDAKLTFQDAYGGSYNDTLSTYVEVAGRHSKDIYDLKVKTTKKPSTIQPGDDFSVAFEVENTSQVPWKNILLSFKAEGDFIVKTQPVIRVDALGPGEKRSVAFELLAPQQLTTNNYPAYLTLSDGSDQTSDHYLGLFVDGDSQNSSKPKIIIDQYNYGQENIMAGETFDLEMVFYNTSQVMGIQNAKVSIASDAGSFVPVDASSSFFIDRIPAGEKVSHTLKLKAKTDLNIQTYNVTASIEYEDSNGNSYDKNNIPYTAEETMGIPVMQELRLEVEELSVQPFGFVYQPSELYVEFFNMGKSTLSNMLVSTEGDFDIQDGKFFVGNFNAGSNDYYSCTLMPLNIGENSGIVIFEFEDAVGEKHRVEKTFSMMAEEMNFEGEEGFEEYPPFPGEFEEPKNSKDKPWLKYIIIASVLLVVIILVVVVLKIRKHKKEMDLDA